MSEPLSHSRQIAEDLRQQVRQGRLREGAMLPGQRALADTYGVSVGTVQQAIAHLLSDGTLRTESKRGTFVAAGSGRSSDGGSALRTFPPPGDTSDVPREGVFLRTGAAATSPARPLLLGIVADLSGDTIEDSQRFNTWEVTMVHAMERTLAEEAETQIRFVNLAPPGGPPVSLGAAVTSLLSDGVDAIALFSTMSSVTEARVDALNALSDAQRLPMVLISYEDLLGPIPNVFYDNRLAGYQAAQHLLRQGYRDLFFLAPFTAQWVQDRWTGVQEAVRRLRADSGATVCRYPPEGPYAAIEQIGYEYETAGYEAARALFTPGSGFTPGRGGVIAANDRTAYGLIRAAAEAGKVAGVDFGLVGFDDHVHSRSLGLTSLHPPLEAMGREAARLLLRGLQGEAGPMQIRLRSHLIPRASTRPVPTPTSEHAVTESSF